MIKKKVLVTGATGFIGRHLLSHLHKLPHLDIYTCSNTPTPEATKLDWIKNTAYIAADLYQPRDDWFSFLGSPDIMIHLAWQGLPDYKGDFHFTRNLFCDYHMISSMVQSGLKSLTITGTCFEYGMQEGCLKEDMCPKPDNPYAISKDTLRRMVEMLKKNHSFSFKWLRLFYMYGEGQNPNSLLSQLDTAIRSGQKTFNMSGGEQIRDYLTVEDMAYNIMRAALQDDLQGIINNCSGKGTKVIDLVTEFLAKTPSNEITLNKGHYPYPDFEPFAFWGDNTRLKHALQAYEQSN